MPLNDPQFVYATCYSGPVGDIHMALYGADNDEEAADLSGKIAMRMASPIYAGQLNKVKTIKLAKSKLFPEESDGKRRFINNTRLLLDKTNPTKQEKKVVEGLLKRLENGQRT